MQIVTQLEVQLRKEKVGAFLASARWCLYCPIPGSVSSYDEAPSPECQPYSGVSGQPGAKEVGTSPTLVVTPCFFAVLLL